MTRILGVSAFYHDSAAALLVDGEIVAAAQEERFSRRKHDPAFPHQAIDYCLRASGLSADRLDYVVFYEKPLRKFERLIETYVAFAPEGFRNFAMAMPVWLREKIRQRSVIRRGLGAQRIVPLVFIDHHESHAASAFFPSPFDEAAILTLDGVGEWSTTTMGVGQGNRITLTHELAFPHSIGLLYSAVAYYCGFKVNSGEYKLMGLAPYGKPVYRDLMLKQVIDIKDDGSFWMDMRYFNYCQGLTMTAPAFHDLFGGPPRRPETAIEQRHMDLAASVQSVSEEVILRMGRELHRQTGMSKLVMAGGVALNCVANGRLLREGPFDDIWIQPAAGDAGGALGGAWLAWHQLLDKPRVPNGYDRQQGSLLGPRFTTDEICRWLDEQRVPYQRAATEHDLVKGVVELLVREKIVGWFQGRMEFGPRALGARSILGDPRSARMQTTMNVKVKFRESFRPFASIVLESEAHKWFDLDRAHASPYMLIVAPVRTDHRVPMDEAAARTMASDPDLLSRLNIARSTIPAVTHVDYSARIQTVDAKRNPRLTALLTEFHRQTGCPVLVNTSFNVRGEPIACSLEDAYRGLLATDMDALVLEDVIVLKEDVADRVDAIERERHLSQFQLD